MGRQGSKKEKEEALLSQKASGKIDLVLPARSRIAQQEAEKAFARKRVEESGSNLPIKVQEAARFLGVSVQTVYLWVERQQIPHFRVMGRNIRFLKSDLRPFRAQFKREVENGTTAQA